MVQPRRHASYRTPLLLGGASVVVVSALVVWLLTSFFRDEILPAQTSPDGSWSVTIRGKRTVFGSIEVTCRKRSAAGAASAWHVVDSLSSWDEFRSKYTQITFEGDVALAGGDRFALRPGVNTWPPP